MPYRKGNSKYIHYKFKLQVSARKLCKTLDTVISGLAFLFHILQKSKVVFSLVSHLPFHKTPQTNLCF